MAKEYPLVATVRRAVKNVEKWPKSRREGLDMNAARQFCGLPEKDDTHD